MQESLYDWEWFVNNFETISQIDLSAYKRPQMERRINNFMRIAGCTDYRSFVSLLNADAEICHKFMEYITINVSEFFRNPDYWRILEQDIIPQLLQQRPLLKVWSAGCSTGEEAYSLAMLFQARFPGHVQSIKATDLDREVLKKAARALYPNKVVRTLPDPYLQRYMQPEGEYYKVIDEIKKMVEFERHDLLKDPYEQDYDLILCRNVFIYMTEASKQNLYRKFAAALRPGGILFIGSTEQIFQAVEVGFHARSTFFYQKN
ncbi:MAG: protein-glutamate O-methyltransferase CheR [Syntrophomonadaceae bacterium]|nr:protein-glutamate O-methyltransferase CheR [Syntrophomonadaceae bacterium]